MKSNTAKNSARFTHSSIVGKAEHISFDTMKNLGKRIDISTKNQSVKQKMDAWAEPLSSLSDINEASNLTWSEVSIIHRSRNGIYQKNGVLKSLLTDLGKISKCYPDIESDDGKTLLYTGSGRRGNQKLDVFNKALCDAVHLQLEVPLFCKIKVNRWKYLGLWRVTDSQYEFDEVTERMVWRFVLRSIE